MKPDNPTQDKLQEVMYLFLQLKRVFPDDDKFRWSLSAFLNAFRSVTFYMQKQYHNVNEFTTWYNKQQRIMEEDDELKFMNSARVESVHIEPVDLGVHWIR